MLDEGAGLGWWATDRNRIPGQVTIYIFALNRGARVNYPSDTPALSSLARLTDIASTRRPEMDAKAYLAKHIPAQSDGSASANTRTDNGFALDMGDGLLYTSLGDFRHEDARSAMLEYLGVRAEIRRLDSTLEDLRSRLRAGDNSAGVSIRDGEARMQELYTRLNAARARAIRLERR